MSGGPPRHDADRDPSTAATVRAPGPRTPVDPDDARRALGAAKARAAILVEGWSDQAALETLARRRGHDLRAEGIVVVPIGGVTNVQRFVEVLGPRGLDLRLAGLYDVAEMAIVRRGLARGRGGGQRRNHGISAATTASTPATPISRTS